MGRRIALGVDRGENAPDRVVGKARLPAQVIHNAQKPIQRIVWEPRRLRPAGPLAGMVGCPPAALPRAPGKDPSRTSLRILNHGAPTCQEIASASTAHNSMCQD